MSGFGREPAAYDSGSECFGGSEKSWGWKWQENFKEEGFREEMGVCKVVQERLLVPWDQYP